jgi:putative Mn2+ efflux pump MntP
MSTLFKTLVLVLSLGLDTFAVAVGLGMSGLDQRQRLRFGLSFALAEGLMPLFGFWLGKAAAAALGEIASYVAIFLLLGVGLYAVWEAQHEQDGAAHGDRFQTDKASWPRLLAVSLSVSMDELAIGFSLGLLGVPVALAVVLIAAQAFILTIIGTSIGRRVGESVAERSELLSGVALSLLALFLLGEKLLKI